MTKLINKNETPSILSRGFQIDGDIKSSVTLEIEGKTKGKIKGTLVIIREFGVVEGSIEADSLSIYGCFSGDIKADIINVFKKAKVIGNIKYNTICVEDGASIDGQFKKIDYKANIANKIANENQFISKVKSA